MRTNKLFARSLTSSGRGVAAADHGLFQWPRLPGVASLPVKNKHEFSGFAVLTF